MNKDLRSLDFSNLDLEPEIQQILSQLLNHIEMLTTELEKVKKENQDLRDEIARLKGGKGIPKIKPNKTDDDNEDDEDEQSNKKKRRPSRLSEREVILPKTGRFCSKELLISPK